MKLLINSLQVLNGVLIIEPTKDSLKNLNKLQAEYKPDKPYECEIAPKKKKRSLNANAYAWVLITEIANVLRTDKEEVYFEMLKKYGQSQVVSVVKEGLEIFKRSVKYCEEWQEAELNGKTFVHVKVFTGSSEFDTREMAIFIDGIVSDCKDLGIETITPTELKRLKNSWGKVG